MAGFKYFSVVTFIIIMLNLVMLSFVIGPSLGIFVATMCMGVLLVVASKTAGRWLHEGKDIYYRLSDRLLFGKESEPPSLDSGILKFFSYRLRGEKFSIWYTRFFGLLAVVYAVVRIVLL